MYGYPAARTREVPAACGEAERPTRALAIYADRKPFAYPAQRSNDEGWYRGQCRFSGIAPAWGEFYEVTGDLKLTAIDDWRVVDHDQPAGRHFLFYLRDETFECEADGWRLET